jgi:hypothetical protein
MPWSGKLSAPIVLKDGRSLETLDDVQVALPSIPVLRPLGAIGGHVVCALEGGHVHQTNLLRKLCNSRYVGDDETHRETHFPLDLSSVFFGAKVFEEAAVSYSFSRVIPCRRKLCPPFH